MKRGFDCIESENKTCKKSKSFRLEFVPGIVDKQLRVFNYNKEGFNGVVYFKYGEKYLDQELSNMWRYQHCTRMVELDFHVNKALCLKNYVDVNVILNYASECHTFKGHPTKAALIGRRKNFEKYGMILDKLKWEGRKDGVMGYCLGLRYKGDKRYKRIIDYCKEKRYKLVHSGRGGYWVGTYKNGVVSGSNKLGEIMMKCFYM